MVILYQSYGVRSSYQQALFSILTLYYHMHGKFEKYRVVVYTDKPEIFEKYSKAIPLSVELLNEKILQAYKGPANFVHRVKICILQDCFAKYKSDILYLDADTYFTRSPVKLLEEIRPGTAIMNSNDYDLVEAEEIFEDLNWLRIRRVIRDHSYTLENIVFKIPLTTRMWNAGVIGMSYQDKDLLSKVLELTDQIYSNKKVFTAEQFAFSFVLQNKLKLIPSGDIIFHYWPDFVGKPWKQTYNFYFSNFFKKYRNHDVRNQSIKAFQLTQLHDQLKLPERTIFYKIIDRLKMMISVARKGKLSQN